MSERIDLGRETVIGTAAQFSTLAVGFIGTVVLARELGPAPFGAFYALLAGAQVLDRPVLGWAAAAKQRLAATPEDGAELLGATLLGIGVWGAVIGGGLVLAAPVLDAAGLPVMPGLLTLLVAAGSGYEAIERLAQGRGRVGAALWTDSGRTVVRVGCQLVFVLAGFGIAGMAWGFIAASVLAVPMLWWFVDVRPALPSSTCVRDLWGYARSSIPSAFASKSYFQLDLLVLATLASTTAAGHYRVAAALTMPATVISGVAATGLMTAVAGHVDDGESEAAAQSTQTVARYSSVLAVPIAVGAMVLAAPLLTTIYGPSYAAGAPILVGLALHRIIQTQSGPRLNALNGADRPDVVLRITAGALVVNLVIGVALLLAIGPLGIVIGTIAAELTRLLWARRTITQVLSDGKLVARTHVEQLAAAGIMAGTVLVARRLLTPLDTVGVALLVGVGAVVYSVALLVISPGIRTTARGIILDARTHHSPIEVL